MALQLTVKPAQKTPAIVSLEARVYLIVSVLKDTEAVQRVVTPVQVRKNHLIFGTRYVSDVFENGHQKRLFSYSIPREEIFENASFSVFLSSFGQMRPRLLKTMMS